LKSLTPPVVSDEAGALSSKSINDIPCDEPKPAASSSDIGLGENEKSTFLKTSYLVRTMLIWSLICRKVSERKKHT
jgi:hypothetical protein